MRRKINVVFAFCILLFCFLFFVSPGRCRSLPFSHVCFYFSFFFFFRPNCSVRLCLVSCCFPPFLSFISFLLFLLVFLLPRRLNSHRACSAVFRGNTCAPPSPSPCATDNVMMMAFAYGRSTRCIVSSQKRTPKALLPTLLHDHCAFICSTLVIFSYFLSFCSTHQPALQTKQHE